MEKKDKSFAKKFIEIISENANSLDSSKFSITPMNSKFNITPMGIRITNKKTNTSILIFEPRLLFKPTLHSDKDMNGDCIAVLQSTKAFFFNANNIKDVINKIDEFELNKVDNEFELNDITKIKDFFGKVIEKYNVSNNTNIADECFVVNNEQQKDSPSKKFIDILSKYTSITEKLGEGEAKIDPKSKKNKIFLNDKWYDRAHWTEESIVKSKINKVFDNYVRGDIDDGQAKQQLSSIINKYSRFFNSTYC